MVDIKIFHNNTLNISKRNLKSFIKLIFKELEISFLIFFIYFIDDLKMLQMNYQFLKHDYFTDIITFNYKNNEPFESEIYISSDEAKRNSNLYKTSLNNEIIRLLIHGLLHIKGYNDDKPKNKQIMKKIENRLVKKYSGTLIIKN